MCAWTTAGFDVLESSQMFIDAKPMAKSIENDFKFLREPSKFHPKSTKMVSRRTLVWSWKWADSRLSTKALRLLKKIGLLVPLGRIWMPFWTQLGAKGSKTQAFRHQDASKCWQMWSQRGCQKQPYFLIRFWLKSVRFEGSWTLPVALYISISLVSADYDKIEKFIKNNAKMVPQIINKCVLLRRKLEN